MNTNHENTPTADELLVIGGTEIKALGDGRIGGYLVLFSSAEDPDLSGDYFTKETDFDLERSTKTSVYYAHGLDKKLGKQKLAEGEMKMDEVGIWVETQLDLRESYQAAIYAMAKSKKLGWSSGSASHLVQRKPMKGANEITKWPLGLDASITPAPAEPRTAAMAIKEFDFQSFEDAVKMLGSEKSDLLNRALREKMGDMCEYLEADEEKCYFNSYQDGKTYACGYKIKEKDGNTRVSIDEPQEVRMRKEFVPVSAVKSESLLDIQDHRNQSSMIMSGKDFVEPPTCSLKDHFDICLLNVRVLKNRLNDLKELRSNQGRKSPLSQENVEKMKELSVELKSLIDETEYATEIVQAKQKEIEEKCKLIDQVYADAAELTDWLESL